MSTYNNTRYIVFIQTKYHQNIPPADDVSSHSLVNLLKTIGHYRGGFFRSIRIYKDDITTLKIYEMNFLNYKNNVLEKSNFWNKTFKKYKRFSSILDFILYNFVYKKEIKYFGNTITNNKPEYLIDKTDSFLDTLNRKRKGYNKDKEGKEIIENLDFNNGELYINEELFELSEGKSKYFLKILSEYLEEKEEYFIDLYDFVEEYEKRYSDDGKDYDYLNLSSSDHIRKSYVKTINNNVLRKYNKEILEIKDNYISFIND